MQLNTEELTEKVSYKRVLEENLNSSADQGEVLVQQNTETTAKSNSNNAKAGLSQEDMNKAFMRNIIIWSSIGLAIIVYFAVYAMMNMTITKSSILYAQYITTKSQRLN